LNQTSSEWFTLAWGKIGYLQVISVDSSAKERMRMFHLGAAKASSMRQLVQEKNKRQCGVMTVTMA
jgi:predicted DNA-binding WGR domain protein